MFTEKSCTPSILSLNDDYFPSPRLEPIMTEYETSRRTPFQMELIPLNNYLNDTDSNRNDDNDENGLVNF